ncbi:MAG: hypothetical protein JWO56_125 [Acidobacteria bacterium]|nr:hypothetical protein [Acidobacteriota bacterium]
MRVILQGSLQHFTAAELLLLVARQAHTGTFDAVVGGGRVRLAFRAGRLVWAEGEDVPAVVAKLVATREGTFTFLDAVALPEGATPLDFDVEPLVEEASRLQQLYPDRGITFRIVNRPEMEGEVSLGLEEFQVLFQFTGGRSLAELLRVAKRPAAELFPIVRKLETNGLIEVVQVAAAAAGATVVAADGDATMRLVDDTVLPKKLTSPGAPIGTLTSDTGTMHPLLEEVTTIGRVPGNDIILSDPSVSSRHARILRGADGFSVEDGGSRNGTFVSSEQVVAPRLLADGDVVRLGKILLTFNLAKKTRVQDMTNPEFKK